MSYQIFPSSLKITPAGNKISIRFYLATKRGSLHTHYPSDARSIVSFDLRYCIVHQTWLVSWLGVSINNPPLGEYIPFFFLKGIVFFLTSTPAQNNYSLHCAKNKLAFINYFIVYLLLSFIWWKYPHWYMKLLAIKLIRRWYFNLFSI